MHHFNVALLSVHIIAMKTVQSHLFNIINSIAENHIITNCHCDVAVLRHFTKGLKELQRVILTLAISHTQILNLAVLFKL